MKLAAILFDFGDTLMIEETEVHSPEGHGLTADLVDGMSDAIRELKARGYRLGIVADAGVRSVPNILRQHDLYDYFDAFSISQQVGVEKPDARMFQTALNALNISPQDYSRVMMVGNRLDRDVRGANNLGLITVHFHWNDRYSRFADNGDKPTYQVHSANELRELVCKLEREP